MVTIYRATVVAILLSFCIPLLKTLANDTSKQESPILRDPFWPINFVPASPDDDQAVIIQASNPIKWPKLKVLGISKSNKGYMALIKDVGTVTKGRILSIIKGRRIYKIRIDSISHNTVKFKNLETTPINK